MPATIRPAYLVVRRNLRGEDQPMVFWDDPPFPPPRGAVYVQRLDSMHGAAFWFGRLPLSDMLAVYQHLKTSGKLPPRWEAKK